MKPFLFLLAVLAATVACIYTLPADAAPCCPGGCPAAILAAPVIPQAPAACSPAKAPTVCHLNPNWHPLETIHHRLAARLSLTTPVAALSPAGPAACISIHVDHGPIQRARGLVVTIWQENKAVVKRAVARWRR